MPNVFQNAIAAGQAAILDHAGATVTFRRSALPNGPSVEVTAVAGASRVEVVDADGMTVTGEVRDFLIAVADLAAVEPQSGDLIEVRSEQTGVVETYEVTPLGDEKCFRPSGTPGTTWRIHTRLIDRAQP